MNATFTFRVPLLIFIYTDLPEQRMQYITYKDSLRITEGLGRHKTDSKPVRCSKHLLLNILETKTAM